MENVQQLDYGSSASQRAAVMPAWMAVLFSLVFPGFASVLLHGLVRLPWMLLLLAGTLAGFALAWVLGYHVFRGPPPNWAILPTLAMWLTVVTSSVWRGLSDRREIAARGTGAATPAWVWWLVCAVLTSVTGLAVLLICLLAIAAAGFSAAK